MSSIEVKGLKQISLDVKKLAERGIDVDKVTKKFAYDVEAMLIAASPAGATGVFRGNWAVIQSSSLDRSIISQYRIVNDLPYAGPLDEGSPKGEKPWPNAGPKTVETGSRIYSIQAPEGISSPIMEDVDVAALSTSIADLIYRSI